MKRKKKGANEGLVELSGLLRPKTSLACFGPDSNQTYIRPEALYSP